jgi:hypothetical protein
LTAQRRRSVRSTLRGLAIIVNQCILHGKYNNNLTFIAQKTADETPQVLPVSAERSRQLVFLSQHVRDKCQTCHFTWKIQQQFDVNSTEND